MLLSAQSRVIATVLASLSLTSVFANTDPNVQQVEAFLQKFDKNPQEQMQTLPMKQKKTKSKFTQAQINSRQFVSEKAEQRKRQFPSAPSGGRSGIEANDQAEQLVDNTRTFETNLSKLNKYKKAALKEQPWSDTYWPLYQGTLASRYADSEFPTDNFKESMDYALKTKFAGDMSFTGRSASSIDDLSPAEKYDLLIGNTKNFEFTRANWAEGKYYWDSSKKVETWMGICHGWAPAAYMLPRPAKKITVVAADGKTKINFFPSDVKALGSLLYAKANVPTKFIGGRCNDKNPKTDSNGRIISQDCFDNNPGSFHTALVNQIGISKRSMVLDATFDYEVWNQPIYSYSYTFFNPKTNKTYASQGPATVELDGFKKDKFKKYRSKDAVSVVGIALDLTYIVETDPSHNLTDSPENDATNTATYMYDLELDADGNIVGGEWYQNTHPDFLWTAIKGAEVVTEYDQGLDESDWNMKKALPDSWQKNAQSAANEQLPLAVIVNKLTAAASKE